jgi:hypothetical protein
MRDRGRREGRTTLAAREVARLLEMSPNTERDYRLALSEAGLLEGDPAQLPELTILSAAIEAVRPDKPPVPQQTSSVEKWRAAIEELANDGAEPTAIYDHLRTEHKPRASTASCPRSSASTPGYASTRESLAQRSGDPRRRAAGHVVQVDFGSKPSATLFVSRISSATSRCLRETSLSPASVRALQWKLCWACADGIWPAGNDRTGWRRIHLS